MTASNKPRFTLEELVKKARPAMYNDKLLDLAAKDLLPTAVMDIAESSGEYNDSLCRAVRYLAIIKRDYGKPVFYNVVGQERIAREARIRDGRESDDVIWEIEQIAEEINDIDSALDYLATVDPVILKEGLERLPRDKDVKFYVRKLAGLHLKLRGLEACGG